MPSARIIKRRLLPFADDKFLGTLKPVCLHLNTLEANNKIDGMPIVDSIPKCNAYRVREGRYRARSANQICLNRD
jgi:hypothetical protein